MTNHYNDSPIDNFDDDKFGISPFAKALATSLLNIKEPVGTTIGLHGPWGSGKSSAVNLIRNALEQQGDVSLVVTEFQPWWFRGEEALALAFLQHLNTILKNTLGDKVKGLLPQIGSSLLQAGPVIGAALTAAAGPASWAVWAGLAAPSTEFLSKRFFSQTETVETAFKKLADILAKEERRFLVIIDDIDRLSPVEALAIFRLVKSVGRLPNVLYLLVYDRELVDAAVQQHFPSEGPHFLEKIIQAPFELPQPLQADINRAIVEAVGEICGEPQSQEAIQRFGNLFFDIIVDYITTPRHVGRLRNAISVTWPAIKDEIDLADFVSLETIRLYDPQLFSCIRDSKEHLCGAGSDDDRRVGADARFQPFLNNADESRHKRIRTMLKRLFPRLEDVGYRGFEGQWSRQRRVCISRYFDTYFRLALSTEAMPAREISSLVEKTGDADFLRTTLKNAAATVRKSGETMVPVVFNELNVHASEVPKANVETLVTVLFALHDEIDRPEDNDKGFFGMENTSLRLHWLIRRLTENRFTIEERSELYKKAIDTASLGWLVDFASSAVSLAEKGGEEPDPNKLLMSLDAATDAKQLALERIRSAANDRTLLEHPDLGYILYRWRDFSEKGSVEVREWTDQVLTQPSALPHLVKAFTGDGRTFTMGFGGLGDRVSAPKKSVQLPDDTEIIDIAAFKKALLQASEKSEPPTADLNIINEFLEIWSKKENSEDE